MDRAAMLPFEAGKDAARNGGNERNSHFGYFTNQWSKDEWQRGYNLELSKMQREKAEGE